MLLTYEAIDAKGKKSTDAIEADSERQAIETLRRKGLFVTSVSKPTNARAAVRPAAKAPRGAHRIPLNALVLFTRQMAMLLRAGSGVVPAMQAIKRQMKKPQHAAVLGSILSDLEDGITLTEALRKQPQSFDPVYCAIIAAGEASASLGSMFERLASMVGHRRAIRNKIIGTMAYPVLLIAMSSKILLVMMFFVLPRFADMFKQLGVVPPAMTRALLATGGALSAHWLIFLLGTIGSVVGIVMLILSDAGRAWMSNVQTSIPIVGRLRSRLIQAQVFRTMGMLLESKVGVLDTLELARQSTRNARYQRLFDAIESTVTQGGQLCTAFESARLVDPSICQAIRTGEESGRLGDAMSYCADVLDESTGEMLMTVMKLVEPVILLGLGFVVGGVAISLFLPLFELTSAMK